MTSTTKRAPSSPCTDLPTHPSKHPRTDPILPLPSLRAPPPTPPPFAAPLPLLTYSHDAAHTQSFTNSALRFLSAHPPIGADLNRGYDAWVRKADTRGRLDGLLRGLVRLSERGEGVKPGVVSWRGVMTKILAAPYEERDGWALNVMLVDGTLYLEEHLTDEQLAQKNDTPPRQRQQMYYGYSFEAWSTTASPAPSAQASSPPGKPVWGGDVNTNEQWCCVVKTRLGPDRLVLGGEVDCVRGEYTGKTGTLVELKTNMVIRNAGDEARFEKKLLRIYLQSFLLGVPEVIVGFRTPNGSVATVQSFQTLALPRMVRGKLNAWDPTVCLAWGAQFLAFVRDKISKDSQSTAASRSAQSADAEDHKAPSDSTRAPSCQVWRATFTPRDGVRLRLLDEEEVADVERDEKDVPRVGLLPRWYWDSLSHESPAQSQQDDANDNRKAHTSTSRETGQSALDGWQL